MKYKQRQVALAIPQIKEMSFSFSKHFKANKSVHFEDVQTGNKPQAGAVFLKRYGFPMSTLP